jgi:uncharacterized membrane protein YhaH (DUF805 family)
MTINSKQIFNLNTINMFKAPFSFNGRIKRQEYALTALIYIVSLIAVSAVSATSPVVGVLILPVIWFLWAQGAKRCHDLGKNGWYQIIPFYPFVLLFSKGDSGRNQYDKDYAGESIPDVLDAQE